MTPEDDADEAVESTEPSGERPPQSRWKRWLVRVCLAGLVLLVLGSVVGFWMYRHHVVHHPGEHMERANIEQIISQESPVLYRDGKTKIGVFFSREHRLYVPYEEIPKDWVRAITASEDQRFFEHSGIDLRGIARAMWANLKAGGVVAGGSSLTQQTAKNLFYRPDRSFRSKWTELVNALRLEAHYSKEEILEYYANQFHVSANGRGIGIGARYFFDKTVAQLTLKECAFLAGMVKAPSRYNPFVGSTPEAQQSARERASARTDTVLRRMKDEGHLSEVELQRELGLPLEFKRGGFRYASSVLLDEVEQRLQEAPFPEILSEAGIDNPSTAGIQVITTLDAQAQRAATYGLWHHLTEAGAQMEGLRPSDLVLSDSKAPRIDKNNPPVARSFRTAVVVDSQSVDLGGFSCALDTEAWARVDRLVAQGKAGNRWAKSTAQDKAALRSTLSPGTVTWVSVREVGEAGAICDFEHRPELQGAVLLAESGQVRAMVGGNDNAHFNRAVSAKRQFGSTWKTLVFQAALHLGWTPMDLLDNRRAVFPFEGTWYYPTPDHTPDDFVSMSWAGVRSENLASIWLLVHMMDRLSEEQLLEMARQTGLAPKAEETRKAYISRIRDTQGVVATRARMRSVSFNKAKTNVIRGLELAPLPEDELSREVAEVMSLSDGWGYGKERERVAGEPERLRALENDFRQLSARAKQCGEELQILRTWLAEEKRFHFLRGLGLGDMGSPAADLEVDNLSVLIEEGRIRVACFRAPEGYEPVADVLELTSEEISSLTLDRNPRIDARIHLSTLEELDLELEVIEAILEFEDPYSLENLIWHPDFRILMCMRYMTQLAQAYGVETSIPQVLSMPLGAVDISLEEAVALYGGMASGERWSFPGMQYQSSEVEGLLVGEAVPSLGGATHLIQEIRDRDGRVLYRSRLQAEQVASEPAAALTLDILTNVVEHGTGRRAAAALPDLWLAGKTGTTNGFRNAAFLGHASSPHGLYTLGAYVGYDDNRSMVRGNTQLHGASGALPAWIGTVEGLQQLGMVSAEERPDGMGSPEGFSKVQVGTKAGLPTRNGEAAVLIEGEGGEARRYYAPLGHVREPLEGRYHWMWP